MKVSSALLSTIALASVALALPTNDNKWDDKKDDKWDDHKPEYHDDKKWGDDKHWDEKHYKHDDFPFHFTSEAVAYAGPDQVVNNSQVAVPGLERGYGKFAFGLNSYEDVICWNITVYIKGNYSSPALTATHIHQAPKGKAGPPRLAFTNPTPKKGENQDLNEFSWRSSFGCLKGPFRTGVVTNGTDTGSGFTIAQLEADPTGFFADTHTVEFPAGAIRGQLQWKDW